MKRKVKIMMIAYMLFAVIAIAIGQNCTLPNIIGILIAVLALIGFVVIMVMMFLSLRENLDEDGTDANTMY